MPDFTGTLGNDSISGTSGDDTISGDAGNDRLVGGAGNDTISGGDDADYITGSDGDDIIDGGAGIDRAGYYQVNAALGGATVSLLLQGVAQNTGSQGNDTLTEIEHLSGTPFADFLTGDANDNWLWGAAATITGGAVSTTNNDMLDGGDGNDLLTVGIGNHTLHGGAGIDTVSFTENGSTETGITVSLNLQGAAQATGNGSWTLTGIENLVGGLGNDSLSGNGSANVLFGHLGNDSLFGGGGNDTLYGDGAMAVFYLGASGPITVHEDVASFFVGGVGGNDFLSGGGGNDTLVGGGGNDSLNGGNDNDFHYAGDGNDFIAGGAGDDLIDGGAGFDRASYFQPDPALGGVTVSLLLQGMAQNTGSQGFDTLVGVEHLSGTRFADILTGDANDNWLWGSGATIAIGDVSTTNDDTLDGGDGNDLLTVGIGDHTLVGGNGIDTVAFTENGWPEGALTISLNSQGSAQTTGNGDWTLTGIENLSGGVDNDSLTGDGGANALLGHLGHDTLIGGGGNDSLYGDGTIAVFFGGSSGPIILHADISPFYVGGVGGNDVLEGGEGDDHLDGGSGSDTASYASAGGSVQVDLGAGTATGADGNDTLVSVENVVGSAFNDILTGDAGANALAGGLGNDALNGGGGIDTVSYANAAGAVTVNLFAGTATGADGNDTLVGVENLLGSAFNDLFIGNNAANAIDGGGSADTIVGFAGDDVINGGAGGDSLYGMQGNDQIFGEDDGDAMWGGTGNDLIDGGAGFNLAGFLQIQNDTISTGVTVDLNLQGSAQDTGQGMDTLVNIQGVAGTQFVDTLIGDEATNLLIAAGNGIGAPGGDDLVYGRGGDDLLVVGSGNVLLDGGSGSDTISFNALNEPLLNGVTVSLALQGSAQNTGSGSMTLVSIEHMTGTGLSDTLIGDANANTLSGAGGNDNLVGGAGDDSLLGDATFTAFTAAGALQAPVLVLDSSVYAGQVAGNDLLEGGLGNDLINGGAGNDTATYANATGGVTVTLTAAGGTSTGADGNDTLVAIENVTGSAFNDTLTGNGLGNVLSGGSGHDRLSGLAGNDTLLGGDGGDSLDGGGGDDVIDGGAGIDRASYNVGASTGVAVDLTQQGSAQNTGRGMDTLTGIEHVVGTVFNDVLTGDSGDNWLWGGSLGSGITGNDIISGGDGNDLIEVGTGNHTLSGGNHTDTLSFFGGGTDITSVGVVFSLASALAQNSGQGLITATGFENMSGSIHNDIFTGNSGDNILAGNGGADQLLGGDGNDALYGDGGFTTFASGSTAGPIRLITDVTTEFGGVGGNDLLEGGLGNDTIDGGSGIDTTSYANASGSVIVDLGTGSASGADGNDTLVNIENIIGSGFDDTLSGDTGANRIEGGAGNDLIVGGLGDDIVDGGEGQDVAQFGGNRADYVVAAGAGGAVAISGADSGNDSFVNVEIYRFADGNYFWDAVIGELVFAPIKIIADGYIAGATAFIDIDRDGTFDSGIEPFAISDANGQFLIASNAVGPLRAVGGTNIDTQLANVLTLSAPEGSTVINPLTTLVEALVAGGLTEEVAEAQVLSAFGLDSSLDLTTFDILAAPTGDAAALAAQKAAASIAEVLTTIVEAAGVGGAEAQVLGVASLAAAVTAAVSPGGVPLDLSDSTTLKDVFTDALPGLPASEIAELAATTQAVTEAIDGAETIGDISIVQGNTAPTAAPDSANVTEDLSVSGNVRTNDSDPDISDTLVVSAVAFGANAGTVGAALQGLYGTLTLNANGSYVYAADSDYLDTLQGVTGLTDVFSYTIADGYGGISTAALTVNVGLADDARTINGTVNADVFHGDQNGLVGAEDTIFGGKGADQLFGNDGSDTLWGGAGNDSLSGGQSRDTLFGEDGNDLLNGGAGDDWLVGGSGNDRLTGGTGADTFVFAKSGGADTITDFQSGTDHIKLDGVTVKSSTFTDVDHNGTLDLILQLSSGSVTLLNVSTPVPAGTFVTPSLIGDLPMDALALHQDALSLFV